MPVAFLTQKNNPPYNAMDYAKFLEWFAPVFNSPMGLLTFGVAVVLGYLLKQAEGVPNALIPWLIIPAAGWFFSIVGDRLLVPDSVPLGTARSAALAGYGVIIGFAAWFFYAQVIKRIEDKFSKDK